MGMEIVAAVTCVLLPPTAPDDKGGVCDAVIELIELK